MKKLYSISGALLLSLLPLSFQDLRGATQHPAAGANATPGNPVSPQEPAAFPFDLHIYMRDSWSSPESFRNPALLDVKACLETCFARLDPRRGPILDARQALNYFYSGRTEQLLLEEHYYMEYDPERGMMVLVCVKTALFSVYTNDGVVAVEVTELGMR